jgi:hypothetical protein
MADKKRFRIGNTTINLGLDDKEIICRFPTNGPINCLYTNNPTVTICPRYHTFQPHCQFFTIDISIPTGGGGCGWNYSTFPPTTEITIHKTIFDRRREVEPLDIKGIKENLLMQLKVIEEQEIELEKSELPQTHEELEMVEKELESRLKEIKNLKKDMKS